MTHFYRPNKKDEVRESRELCSKGRRLSVAPVSNVANPQKSAFTVFDFIERIDSIVKPS